MAYQRRKIYFWVGNFILAGIIAAGIFLVHKKDSVPGEKNLPSDAEAQALPPPESASSFAGAIAEIKKTPPRSLRLCGENPILDKNDIKLMISNAHDSVLQLFSGAAP